ncbi:MAG: ribosome recycling factor [Alloprevotella sp.]|nr:ribosome recycling factor [Alloprevotella sp.]
MFDVKQCLAECEEKMDLSVMHLEDKLASIRAGKANVRILDDIRVNSYGTMSPLNAVASVTTPDARTIAIKPWDKSMFPHIEKAIINSEVGITPENNGEIIRLTIPPLTEERRKLLTKQCGKEAEEAKMAIRNARRDGIDKLKKAEKEGLSEDNRKDAEADLQKIHDKKIKDIERILEEKNKEIMTV